MGAQSLQPQSRKQRVPAAPRPRRAAGFARLACGFLLLAGCATGTLTQARADEFSIIPSGDPLYGDFANVKKAGWLPPTANTNHTLTRYEVALETAKAIFAVTALQRADANWARTAPRAALRSLKGLTFNLRDELKQLNLDVNATINQIDQILTRPVDITRGTAPIALTDRTLAARPAPSGMIAPVGPGNTASRLAARRTVLEPLRRPDVSPSRLTGQRVEIPLSQSLRVETALLALRRESYDPFGDRELASRPLTARQLQGSAVPIGIGAGAAYDVTNWMTVRAGYSKLTAQDDMRALQRSLAPGATAERSVGGSVDINLRGSLTVTSGIAHVSTEGTDATSGTRYEGGLGLSAWQNRVLLSANLSRLVPEDSIALEPHTAARFGVGVDVTERLSLKLLYQGIFGAPDQNHVAGGISIHW